MLKFKEFKNEFNKEEINRTNYCIRIKIRFLRFK